MTKLLFLQDLDLDNSPMVRAKINEDTVEDYADIYKAKKVKLPPIDVFTMDKGKTYLLGDGMHRVNALVQLCAKTVEGNVHVGGYEDALKFALTANERHGLRRTNADKRRCVQEAIKQWPKKTDHELAGVCAVEHRTVTAVRDEMEKKGAVKPEPVRESKTGRQLPAKATGNSRSEPSKPLETKDNVGTVIPVFAMQYWIRTPDMKELLGLVAVLSKTIKMAQKNEDLMFAEINPSAALADIDRLWTNLNGLIPYAVCTVCQGHPKTQPKGECRLCKGRGLISKYRWDTLVPKEIKMIKEKK